MKNKWLLISGAIAALFIAWTAGVSLGALLIVCALLLCPAAMFFGTRGSSGGDAGGDCPSCEIEPRFDVKRVEKLKI